MVQTPLSPQDVLAKARRFNVDLSQEPYLISLMKQAAVTPAHWAAGKQAGCDDTTPQTEGLDASDSYFTKQIQEMRTLKHETQDDQDAETTARGGWMEFEEPSATDSDPRRPSTKKYYYDFVTKTRQEHHPLTKLHGLDSLRIADPHVFEQAASLHSQSSSMQHIEQLEILCFHSWWSEGSLNGVKARRQLHLYFSIPTRHFQLVLDDSDSVFTISHIVGPTGSMLTAWDLHVGARILVLGRLTTLMQASLLTRQWLQLQEKKLLHIQQQLLTELRKYELKRHGLETAKPRVECADPHKSQAGVSLRKVLNDIEELKKKLSTYRLDVVRRICEPLMQLEV